MDLELMDDVYDGIQDTISSEATFSTLTEETPTNEELQKSTVQIEKLYKDQKSHSNNPAVLDLYSELLQADNENKLQKAKKDKEEFDNLVKENMLLKIDNDTLNEQLQKFKEENEILKSNISSLYKTAKSEIDFKRNLIHELRTELDEYLFRRKVDVHKAQKHSPNNRKNSHHLNSKQINKSKFPESSNSLELCNKNPCRTTNINSIDDGETNTKNTSSSNSNQQNIENILEKAFDEFAERQVIASADLLDAVRSFEEQQMGLIEKLKQAALIVFKGKNSSDSQVKLNGMANEKLKTDCSNFNKNVSPPKKCDLTPKNCPNSLKRDIYKLYNYQDTDVPFVIRRQIGLPIKNPSEILKSAKKTKNLKFDKDLIPVHNSSNANVKTIETPSILQPNFIKCSPEDVHSAQQNVLKFISQNFSSQAPVNIKKEEKQVSTVPTNLLNLNNKSNVSSLKIPNQNKPIFDWSCIMSESSIASSLKETCIVKSKTSPSSIQIDNSGLKNKTLDVKSIDLSNTNVMDRSKISNVSNKSSELSKKCDKKLVEHVNDQKQESIPNREKVHHSKPNKEGAEQKLEIVSKNQQEQSKEENISYESIIDFALHFLDDTSEDVSSISTQSEQIVFDNSQTTHNRENTNQQTNQAISKKKSKSVKLKRIKKN